MNIDLVLVKHFFPSYEAGQYAAVALVGRVLFYASWAVIHAMFPIAAQNGARQAQSRRAGNASGAGGLIFVGFLGVLAIAPGMVMKTLFGARLRAGRTAARALRHRHRRICDRGRADGL